MILNTPLPLRKPHDTSRGERCIAFRSWLCPSLQNSPLPLRNDSNNCTISQVTVDCYELTCCLFFWRCTSLHTLLCCPIVTFIVIKTNSLLTSSFYQTESILSTQLALLVPKYAFVSGLVCSSVTLQPRWWPLRRATWRWGPQHASEEISR